MAIFTISYIYENTSVLNNYRKEIVNDNIINKYKLIHIRTNDNIKSIAFFDKDNLVAIISVETKDNGEKWIQALEVYKGYKQKGIGKAILEYAVKILKANFLSVRKTNTIAYNMYLQYGFRVYNETDKMYFMKLK